MIKEFAVGIISILISTIVVYPVSSTIADVMGTLMGSDLASLIVITLVRYIGFFIGVAVVYWIYKGVFQRQQPVYNNMGGY